MTVTKTQNKEEGRPEGSQRGREKGGGGLSSEFTAIYRN